METCENDVGTCGNDVRIVGDDVGMSETSWNAWGRYVDTRGNYNERERLEAMWERVGTMWAIRVREGTMWKLLSAIWERLEAM